MGDTAERNRATASAYDTVAADYERRFADELDHKPRDRALLDALARTGTGPVVDIGCGPGHVGAHVRSRGRPVIGVDLSHRLAVLAAKRLDGVVVADAGALPLATSSVGDIAAFYSLIHLRRCDLTPALAELVRVTVPGGRLILAAHEGEGDVRVTEFLGHPVTLDATFFSLDELVAAATSVGLDVVLAERRPPYDLEGPTDRIYLVCRAPGRGTGHATGGGG